MRVAAIICAAAALLLTGGAVRLSLIQAHEGESLRNRAARQQTVRQVLPALRGEILDTRGRVLAASVQRPGIFADPALVADPRYAACSLAPILGLAPEALEATLREPSAPRFIWLKRGLSEAELAGYERVAHNWGLAGFGVRYEVTRAYPQGRLAPHVLGFVGVDRIVGTDEQPAYEDLRGLAGIEAAYDAPLRGVTGRRTATVDVVRRRVRAQADDFVSPIDGATVVLTIDAFIQQIAQDALARAMEAHKPQWGAAIVLDPHTGEVLAMATVPDFDPADPFPAGYPVRNEAERKRTEERWRNRAVMDSYEPGSIFKPFIASCALDEGLTRLDEVFAINGPTRSFGKRTIHDTHPYTSLTMHEVISKSSNIGMGLLGARCGMERLHRYVRQFGFGEATGIGLPGEHTGLVLQLSRWNPSFSPQSIPIGQEIAVTPLQVVTAFSVFCNGGKLMRPRIVRGVIAADGQTLSDNSCPVEVRQVLKPETARRFRLEALAETVISGTGKQAAVPGYQVFGKTGTAQVAAPKGRGYISGAYVASFVGGAPAEDPRIVVLVSLYRPAGGKYYGGTIAAPVVKEIIAQTLAYMQVPPETPEVAERPVRAARR